MNTPPFISAAERYLARLESALADRPLSPSRAQTLFDDFLALTNAPPPDPRLLRHFHNDAVLIYLAHHLFVPFAWSLRHALDRVGNLSVRHRENFFRIRALSARGALPNSNLHSGRATYAIHEGRPYLVTVNSPREEAKWSYGSDLANWTRHETRLATAITCAEFGGFTPYLSGLNYDLPVTAVQHVDKQDQVAFLLQCASLLIAVQARKPDPVHRTPLDDANVPRYFDFRPYKTKAEAFASRFLVSHQLLLRTAKLLLKSSMLWHTDGFSEDALANLCFALEGCMLLFQDVLDAPTDRLNRKLLRETLVATFEHGNFMYDLVEEALGWGGTRAQLVHPHLALEGGWLPLMTANEYFELHRMVRLFLTYLVTGTSFDEYPLSPGLNL